MEILGITTMSAYGQFHCANIGYQWKEKTTNKIIDKGMMFLKFQEYPKRLSKLTSGFDKDFERIEKSDYKNGVWHGIAFSIVGGVRLPY